MLKKLKLNEQFLSWSFGFFNELYLIFCETKREKRKKFVEIMGFEPQSPGWEARVLTTTPLGNSQEQAQNLRINQSSTIFH